MSWRTDGGQKKNHHTTATGPLISDSSSSWRSYPLTPVQAYIRRGSATISTTTVSSGIREPIKKQYESIII